MLQTTNCQVEGQWCLKLSAVRDEMCCARHQTVDVMTIPLEVYSHRHLVVRPEESLAGAAVNTRGYRISLLQQSVRLQPRVYMCTHAYTYVVPRREPRRLVIEWVLMNSVCVHQGHKSCMTVVENGAIDRSLDLQVWDSACANTFRWKVDSNSND